MPALLLTGLGAPPDVAIASSTRFHARGVIVVEADPVDGVAEAKWISAMAQSPGSLIRGLVAHIPVADGAAAVKKFLASVDNCSLLRGGRVTLMASAPEACLTTAYFEGLAALCTAGIPHWEFGCTPEYLPSVIQVCKALPDMQASKVLSWEETCCL